MSFLVLHEPWKTAYFQYLETQMAIPPGEIAICASTERGQSTNRLRRSAPSSVTRIMALNTTP